MIRFMSSLLVVLFFSGNCFSQADSIPGFVRDSLDIYVERSMADWKIPGVAVCIVKNGKAVVMKGYGVKEMGIPAKVDENTLFMIGSNSKAFTATALAMLQSDKKLSLDDNVRKWLPDFKLYDPWVSNETNIRDLLCHRLGFETFQGDFMYFDSDLSTQQVMEKFSKVKPLYGFRGKWGYCNAAFMTAGEIISRVSGKKWEEFITERIFKPLEMNNSIALSKDIHNAENKAIAHTVADGILKRIAYGNIDNLAAAGSISSSVNDLSHWLIMQLDNGKYNGKEIVTSSAISQTRLPHSILGNGGTLFNKGHFSLYGLGWFLREYNGRKIVEHSGGVNGFVTSVALVPEENLGIVVLTNTDANNFYDALKAEIMDAYLGLPYRNYSNVYLAGYNSNELEREKQLKAKRDTIAMNLKTGLPLQSYAGNYAHEVYGKMTIAMENGKLVARFQHHKGRFAEVEPLGGNRFLASFNDPLYGKKVWPFTVANGKVKSVTVRVADFVEFTPYEFVKE